MLRFKENLELRIIDSDPKRAGFIPKWAFCLPCTKWL